MSKSIISVMFALLICVATAATAQRRSKPADTLIELWQDSNSRCRGGPGDSPLTGAACMERERYAMRLDKLGRCYGKRGQSGSQMSWHICTSDSYHFEGDGRSSGSAGKLTELPSERLSTAPSLESLLGRWYTDNANVCKGTVGNTEGLLTFSGKRFTGYENECLINKARVEGQTLKIQMTCSGEGEESQETEWFEFVNEKQAKRSVVDGKRRQIALGMFTGLRKGDVLTLTKAAIRDGKIWRRTSKTGQEVSIPVHPDLAHLLATAPRHDAITIAATTRGTPWTESGFNSSFIKAMAKLKRGGKVGDGLTFHGLRHTVGTLLIEAGYDLDTVRRWLGQKTLAMAIHYSETADTSDRMSQVIKKFDPLGSKSRT